MFAIVLLSCIALTGILIFSLPYWLIVANPFPPPSGKWQIGTSDLIWDRPNLSGIIAKVWYPTDLKNGIDSPYIDNIDRTLSALTKDLNPLLKLIFNKRYFDRLQIPAAKDATIASHSNGFPVILFSPGLGGLNFLNTFYALEFASYGFIVIGINHPGMSATTLLTNGLHIGLNETAKELFKDVTNNLDRLADKIINEQSDNISTVLDRVISLNSTNDSFLDRKVDIEKIYTAGHSVGGSASFIACGIDRRISKAINFDGYFFDSDDTNYSNKELLLITGDRDRYPKSRALRHKYQMDLTFTKDRTRVEQLSAKANLKQQVCRSADHFNFSDISLIIKPAFGKATGFIGDVDGRKLLSETATIAIEFLNT